MAEEATFHRYKISAHAQLLGGDTWTGSYLIEKDGRVIRARHSITWRHTAKLAEVGALVFGIQFVDHCLARKQRVDETRLARNDKHIALMAERSLIK